MKKLTLIFLVSIFGTSCKKNDQQPTSNPPRILHNLYMYRAYGLNLDTANFYVNGVKIEGEGYNIKIDSGSVVSFYYTGDTIVNKNLVNFAIWKNENALPSESIKYFYPIERRVIRKIVKNGPAIYRSDFILKGQFTVTSN